MGTRKEESGWINGDGEEIKVEEKTLIMGRSWTVGAHMCMCMCSDYLVGKKASKGREHNLCFALLLPKYSKWESIGTALLAEIIISPYFFLL